MPYEITGLGNLDWDKEGWERWDRAFRGVGVKDHDVMERLVSALDAPMESMSGWRDDCDPERSIIRARLTLSAPIPELEEFVELFVFKLGEYAEVGDDEANWWTARESGKSFTQFELLLTPEPIRERFRRLSADLPGPDAHVLIRVEEGTYLELEIQDYPAPVSDPPAALRALADHLNRLA